MRTRKCTFSCSALLLLLSATSGYSQDYETPTTFSAKQWWDNADWLETSLWKVDDSVNPRHLLNQYQIKSVYGTFEANGDYALINRLKEIEAIHTLRGRDAVEASGDGVLGTAGSKLKVGKDILKDPGKVAGDIPRGALAILRRGGSLTHKARRSGDYGSTTGPVKSFLGADDQKRKIAAMLDFDPYTDNQVLQTELNRVATLEAIPNFAVGFAIPGNGFFTVLGAGNDSRIVDAYQSSPSDLFVRNRKTLIEELGASKSQAGQFLSLKHATPAQQTIFIQSLSKLKNAGNRLIAVDLASQTETREEFDFYRRNAELLAWYQENGNSLQELAEFNGMVIGIDRQNQRVLPFAVDFIGWCPDCGGLLENFSQSGNDETVVTTGRLTSRAKAELKKRGVSVEIVGSLQ